MHKDTHMKCYSNLDYHPHDVYAVMMNMKSINKEVDCLAQELSIENIVLSIRQLKEQVKKLETKRVYDIQRPDHI